MTDFIHIHRNQVFFFFLKKLIFYSFQTIQNLLQVHDTMTDDHSFSGNSKAEWRAIVIKFYETYNPEKLKDVDVIMKEFDGRYAAVLLRDGENTSVMMIHTKKKKNKKKKNRESELLQELVNKYNVRTQVVVNEVSEHSPTPSIASQHFIGNSTIGSIPQQRVSVLSDRSSVASDGLRTRLHRLRQHHPHADEGELMISAVEQQRSWRNAIIRFYQEHQPSKLTSINDIFNECDGEEEALYNLIVSKYKSTSNLSTKQHNTIPQQTQVRNAVTQCMGSATSQMVLPTTPLTTQLDITGGEVVGIDDIGDQLEWSVLVVLEQEERMRGILSKISQKGGDPRILKETADRLMNINREANAIRKLFDSQVEQPPPPVVISSLPPPPIIGGGGYRDRASTSPPMVTPSSFAVPLGAASPFVRRRSESSSPSLQRHLISPPAPLPSDTLGVNTQALIDAVSALQKKGVTMPSPQELRLH